MSVAAHAIGTDGVIRRAGQPAVRTVADQAGLRVDEAVVFFIQRHERCLGVAQDQNQDQRRDQ